MPLLLPEIGGKRLLRAAGFTGSCLPKKKRPRFERGREGLGWKGEE